MKEDPNAWMVTFGDLIMLLLTFFVLLLTMKSMDAGKVKEFFEQFTDSIGPLEYADNKGRISLTDKGRSHMTLMTITESSALEEAMALLEGIDRAGSSKIELQLLRETLEISEDQRGVVITLASDGLFASGQAQIEPVKRPILDGIGHILRHVTNDILIMGHTDNQPDRTSGKNANWDLSFARALGILNYFTVDLGLAPERLAAGGYGDSRPRLPNDSSESRARNRRVEFILRTPH